MINKKLSRLLNKRQVDISQGEGHLVTKRELAIRAEVDEKSLGRWFDGIGTPDPKYWSGLARVFGDDFYIAIGQRQPIPDDIDPGWLDLIRKSREHPDIAYVLEQAKETAETMLNNKNVSKSVVTAP